MGKAQDIITVNLTNPKNPEVQFGASDTPKDGVLYGKVKFTCAAPLGFDKVQLTNDHEDLNGSTTVSFGTGASAIKNGDEHILASNKLGIQGKTVDFVDETFNVGVVIGERTYWWPPKAQGPDGTGRGAEGSPTRFMTSWFGEPGGTFIPDKTTDNYPSWLLTPRAGAAPRRPGYVIGIDMTEREPYYIKIKRDGSEVPMKRLTPFHPLVGSQIRFRLTNYYPRTQSLTIETSSHSYNTELQNRFAALWDPASAATTNIVAHSDEKTLTPDEELARQMCHLLVDLQTLYNDLQTLDAAGQITERGGLQRIQDHVSLRIMIKLGFDPDAPDAFIKKGEAIAKGMNKADQDTFGQVVTRAQLMYALIGDIGAQNQHTVHMPDDDALKAKLKYFKRGATAPEHEDEITLWARGGFKIDFSAGLAYTMLVDEEFEAVFDRTDVVRDSTLQGGDTTVTVTNTARYRIAEKSGTDYNIGASIMAHAYYRTGAYINPAISVGFLVNNNTPTQYLVGGSLAIGHQARLVLTAGTAFGKVKRLRTGLLVGGDIDSGATAVPTEEEWHNNFFFGVAFNFAKLNVPAAANGASNP